MRRTLGIIFTLILPLVIGLGCRSFVDFAEMKYEPTMISPPHQARLCETYPSFEWEIIQPIHVADYYDLYINGEKVISIPTSAHNDNIITYDSPDEFLYSPEPYRWTVIARNEYQIYKHYGTTDENGDNPEEWYFYIADCEPPTVSIIVPEDEEIVKFPQEVNGVSADNVGVTVLRVYIDRYAYEHYIDSSGDDLGYKDTDLSDEHGFECVTYEQWFPEHYCLEFDPENLAVFNGTQGGGYTYTITQDMVEELGLSEGRHGLTAEACDAAGNCAETSITIIIKPSTVEWPEDTPGIVMIPSAAWGAGFGPGEYGAGDNGSGPWFNPVTGGWGWGNWGWGWGLGIGWGWSGWFPWGWGGFGGFGWGGGSGWTWDGMMIPEDAYSCDSDTPSFSWHEMENAATYEFQLTDIENIKFDPNYVPDPSTSPNGPGVFVHETNLVSTWYSVSSALPEYAYIYRARGITADGTELDWSDMMLAAVAKLEPPDLLNPPDNWVSGDNNPVFTWTQVFGASGYELQISGDPAFSEIAHSVVVSETEYYFTEGLPIESEYYWRVRAVIGDACEGAWSDPNSMEIPSIDVPELTTETCTENQDCQLPCETEDCEAAPCSDSVDRHCNVTDFSPTQPGAMFEWTEVPGTLAYHWELYDNQEMIGTPLQSGMLDTNGWTPTTVERGDYYFRVRSMGAMRYSDWTNSCHFFRAGLDEGTTLISENGVTATGERDCNPTPDLVWQTQTYAADGDPAKDAEYYLELYDANTSGAVLDTAYILDGTTSHTVGATALPDNTNDTTYVWRVRTGDTECPANQEGGYWTSTWTYYYEKIAFAPTNQEPIPGTPLQGVDNVTCDTQPVFRWSTTYRANKYRLQITPNTSGTDDTSSTCASCVTNAYKTTGYVETGLTNDTAYYWRVRGENDTCEGPYSAWQEFKIEKLDDPTMTPITSPNSCSLDPDFSWTAVTDPDATGYMVQFDGWSAQNVGNITTGTATDLKGAPFSAAGTYKWRVAPYNASCPNDYIWTAWESFDITAIGPVADVATDTCGDPVQNWGKVGKKVGMSTSYEDDDNAVLCGTDQPIFRWGAAAGVNQYIVEVSTDSTMNVDGEFTTIATTLTMDSSGNVSGAAPGSTLTSFSLTIDGTPPATEFDMSDASIDLHLQNADMTVHYWHVKGKETTTTCESPDWTEVKRFRMNVLDAPVGTSMDGTTCPNSGLNGNNGSDGYVFDWDPPTLGAVNKYLFQVYTVPPTNGLWGNQNRRVYDTYKYFTGDCTDNNKKCFEPFATDQSPTITLASNKTYYWKVWGVMDEAASCPDTPGAQCFTEANTYEIEVKPDPNARITGPTDDFQCADGTGGPVNVELTWAITGDDTTNAKFYELQVVDAGVGGTVPTGDSNGNWYGVGDNPSPPQSNYMVGSTQGLLAGTSQWLSLTPGIHDLHVIWWRVRTVDAYCLDDDNHAGGSEPGTFDGNPQYGDWQVSSFTFTPLVPPVHTEVTGGSPVITGAACATTQCGGGDPAAFTPVCDTSSLTFKWGAVNGAETYEFVLSTDPTHTPSAIKLSDPALAATEITVTNLEYGHYYWNVAAQKDICFTDYSNQWHFIVGDIDAPTQSAPADGATNVSITNDSINWDAPTGTSTYTYEIYTGGTCSGTPITETIALNGKGLNLIGGLAGSTTYAWRVRGNTSVTDGSCQSDWSACRTFTTQ